jgi:hypothetical protein
MPTRVVRAKRGGGGSRQNLQSQLNDSEVIDNIEGTDTESEQSSAMDIEPKASPHTQGLGSMLGSLGSVSSDESDNDTAGAPPLTGPSVSSSPARESDRRRKRGEKKRGSIDTILRDGAADAPLDDEKSSERSAGLRSASSRRRRRADPPPPPVEHAHQDRDDRERESHRIGGDSENEDSDGAATVSEDESDDHRDRRSRGRKRRDVRDASSASTENEEKASEEPHEERSRDDRRQRGQKRAQSQSRTRKSETKASKSKKNSGGKRSKEKIARKPVDPSQTRSAIKRRRDKARSKRKVGRLVDYLDTPPKSVAIRWRRLMSIEYDGEAGYVEAIDWKKKRILFLTGAKDRGRLIKMTSKKLVKRRRR